MAEENKTTLEEKRMVILGALTSTDASGFTTEADWLRAVAKRSNTIARCKVFNEGGLFMRMLDSVRIRATITDVAYEESSTRYVISFVAENGDGQVETIRTVRTDSADGEILLPLIERLKKCAGTDAKVLIFKNNELPTEEQKEKAKKEHRTIPAQGYRNAVWFEFLK